MTAGSTVPLGTRSANAWRYEAGRGPGGLQLRQIFAVVEKGQFARARIEQRFHVVDQRVRVGPCASCAPTFSASACRRNGAALSKNPGCSIEPP